MRVKISVHCGGGWLHKHCAMALLRLQSDRRFETEIILPTHSPYVESLHQTINEVLDGDCEYWLTFDNDNPPVGNPLHRIDLNLDVIGFPTPVWNSSTPGDYPIYFNGLLKKDDGYLPLQGASCKGIKEVDAVGSGCMLIHRRVLEKMASDPPMDRWFMRQWNDKGLVEYGGDYSFCQRVKRHGFRIYCDYDNHCLHFNEIELCEVINSFEGAIHG